MATDIKFWKEEGSFKFRVCGVIKVGDKFLINNCDDSWFWSYPGGHVQLGESTETAVKREVLEETKIDCDIEKLLAVVELFFDREDGKIFHEIGFYYLLKPKNIVESVDFVLQENDNGKLRNHQFKWVDMDTLESLDVRPTDLKKVLRQNLENQHIIHVHKE